MYASKRSCMSKNPYASASDVEETADVRSRRLASRKMLWFGSLTAVISFLVFCVLISRLFFATSQVGNATPDPAVVADQISSVLMPLVLTVFVGLGGLICLVIGLDRAFYPAGTGLKRR